MGGSPEERPAAYRDATVEPSSSGQRDAERRRVHLLQGAADTVVAVEQAELAGAANAVLPRVGHFDWIHPGSRAFRTLLEVLLAISSQGAEDSP